MSVNTKSTRLYRMTLAAILMAILFLMGFTPLGYLRIGPAFEITFSMIPVAIGAVVLGPAWGAFLGGIFGLTSFLQCVLGTSAFGVILFELKPFATVVTCFVPRILMGFLTGLLFRCILRVDRTRMIAFAVSTICSAVFNTVFFIGSVLLFFRRTEFLSGFGETTWKIILALVSWNALVELAVCCIVSTALAKGIVHFLPNIQSNPTKTAD